MLGFSALSEIPLSTLPTAAGGPANYAIAASAGSYAVSGVSATVAKSKVVTALTGSYAYTGQAATVAYAPVGAYSITANAGAYTYSGVAANIVKTSTNTAVYWGGIPSRKRNKEYEQPTPEQVEAERIRLGIIEAKKEVIVIANKVKDKPLEKQVEPRQQLNKVRREIARLESEYAIKKAQLVARGELIRSEAIYRAAMHEMEKRRSEESDIAFLMAFLAEC